MICEGHAAKLWAPLNLPAKETLVSMQMTLNKPVHKLTQETDTRWNSMYDMMVRFLEQMDSFGTALAAVDFKIELLTLAECPAVQQLLIVLRRSI
jgi:hypothetical protein